MPDRTPRPPAPTDTPSRPPRRPLTPARVAGLLTLSAGVLATHAVLDLLGDAVARAELSRAAFGVILIVYLLAVAPILAGGVYLVHKGRIDPDDAA